MKIKLLKELPGYEVGEEVDTESNRDFRGYAMYSIAQLIKAGWAEEIIEAKRRVWNPEKWGEYLLKTVWDIKKGDEYFLIMDNGNKSISIWEDSFDDINRRKYCNCFLTEEDVDMEVLRRESQTQKQKP